MFDFVNDDKLQGVPLGLRMRMQMVQEERIKGGHTSKDGLTYRTLEKKQLMDDVYDWKTEGGSIDQLESLKLREKSLRKLGKF